MGASALDGRFLGPQIDRGIVGRGRTGRRRGGEARALKRTLSALNLVALGVGGIIGAGIFVLTGHAAAANAGPAVALSFLLGAVACAFAGLCYAEMSSAVPISGSAYTYAYATLGELVGVDHRLGSDPRICRRRHHGRDRLVRICREFCQGSWHRPADPLCHLAL